MKKIIIAAIAAFGLSTTAVVAQISDANPTATTLKVGNRAKAGDFGLYIGATSNKFGFQNLETIGGQDFKINPIPLVNLKYMVTDHLEARLGIEFTKYYEGLSGDKTVGEGESEKTYSYNGHYTKTENNIYPGVAYHFSRSNILDVYAGGELQIGWSRDRLASSYGDDYNRTRKNCFQMGLGAFIGLQAYICNLPIAVGVEYGIYSLLQTGQKWRNSAKSGDNDEVVSYYTTDKEMPKIAENNLASLTGYDKLGGQKGSLGNQVRVTLTYFFNR